MTADIISIPKRTFAGMQKTMSLANDQTFELFSQFMPRKKEFRNNLNNDVFDLIVYPPAYFEKFEPTKEFVKWALMEVEDFDYNPVGMESFTLQAGEYAVFSQPLKEYDQSIFEKIFTEWMPQSKYEIDERPHFDILIEEIQKRNPDAIQEIWIPIRL